MPHLNHLLKLLHIVGACLLTIHCNHILNSWHWRWGIHSILHLLTHIEGYGTSYCYRHRKVWQTRVCNIKIRNGKFYLIVALEIDKIDFSLKWTLSTKC